MGNSHSDISSYPEIAVNSTTTESKTNKIAEPEPPTESLILQKVQKPISQKPRMATGVSLKNLMEETHTKPLENENNIDLPKDEFEEEQVLKFWEQLLITLADEEKTAVLGAIKNGEIRKVNELEINMLFNSHSSKVEFDKIKNTWIADLKKELNNFHIEVTAKVEVTDKNKPNIKQPIDVYKEMVSKNPNLEKLRKDLDLDFYS